MAHYDYVKATKLIAENPPIEGLIMAAMMKADLAYLEPLKRAFPDTYKELHARRRERGGVLPGEDGYMATGQLRPKVGKR